MQTLMDLMTWQDFEHAIRDNRPIILPVGSLEQHGLHLPLGTDTFITSEIAKRAAKKTGSIVAPVICYGYKPQPGSSGGNNFAGTCSLDGSTLIMLIRDIVRELFRHKVRRVLVLDGHYENSLFINEGVDLALRSLPNPRRVKVVIVRWFEVVPENLFAKLFGKDFESMALEHASKVESSMMMAIDERSVQKRRMRNDAAKRRGNYAVLPEQSEFIPKSGSLTSVFPSSRKLGDQVLQYASRQITLIIRKEFPR
jgi:creatinine amidohydrolase